MGIFNLFTRKKITEQKQEVRGFETSSTAVYGNLYPIPTRTFDGEKTPGELGNVINLIPDYNSLRLRAYEQELKSDLVKIITGKFFKWVVGTGLELQCQPNDIVLETEGVNVDLSDLRRKAEARFKVYSNSKRSSFSGMTNLHRLALDAFKTAFLGGDCLIVYRVVNGSVNCQVIDGQEIVTPFLTDKFHKEAEERGNKIIHGIEISPKGEHIAFFVRKQSIGFVVEIERIEAKSKSTGRTLARMIYGSKHRINHHRGVSNISAIIEKVEKLDRYTEATVSSAEERAKITYSIEHTKDSTGENPLLSQIKKTINNADTTGGSSDPYGLGETLQKRITATTNKQTFNMPIGSKLESLDSTNEINYPAFFEAIFAQLCASADIPPEVALQKYDSNYSASRAAINGWGFIIDIYRKNFSTDFYKPFYELWLELEIINNKLNAPGYLVGMYERNEMLIEAYGCCRFTGVNLPHIDPLKEVKAVREMLGDETKGQTPLISRERATEILNQGEWSENYKKYKEESKKTPELKDKEDGSNIKNKEGSENLES